MVGFVCVFVGSSVLIKLPGVHASPRRLRPARETSPSDRPGQKLPLLPGLVIFQSRNFPVERQEGHSAADSSTRNVCAGPEVTAAQSGIPDVTRQRKGCQRSGGCSVRRSRGQPPLGEPRAKTHLEPWWAGSGCQVRLSGRQAVPHLQTMHTLATCERP